jgi:hypothetical protein
MSDQPEIDPTGEDRRGFLKKMAVAGFAVPAVATFSTVGIEAAFAQTANASGTTTTTGATTSTTAATTTATPTTTAAPTTTVPPTTTTTTTTTTEEIPR